MRFSLTGIFFVAILVFFSCKVAVMPTPVLHCYSATQVSITLDICAGDRAAPDGFTIQWMTKADNDANGWPVDFNNPIKQATFCEASFSGNANLSGYNLAEGRCVLVNIGESLFDNGAHTGYPGALTCGTAYVFRSLVHATSRVNKSAFSENEICSTLARGSTGQCTLTQGYWKTHGPTGTNSSEWKVASLTLGTVGYTDVQLLSIFKIQPGGNGLIALAHQLIAAKLNIANGADGSSIQSSIDAADALIDGLIIPPVGSGSLAASAPSALITALTNYNEGATGPGHCN